MKIKDIGRVVTGKTPLTGVNEYYGGNIMFISPSDLHGDYLIEKSEKTITDKGAYRMDRMGYGKCCYV